MISLDTETRSLRWWEGDAFLATWAGADYEDKAVLREESWTGGSGGIRFLRALADNEVLIAHNAIFDAHQIRETLGYCVYENEHTVHDTLLMSKVVFGRSRVEHGLESLSRDLLPDGGKAGTKADISDIYRELTGRTSMKHDDAYYDVWVKDSAALEAYAMADVRDTYDLYSILRAKLDEDPRLVKLYELELEVQRVLYDAERRGVRVDPEAVARLQAHHASREDAARTALLEHLGFIPEGDGSEEALRQRLPEVGVALTERSENGELSVSRPALAKFEDHPAVAALFDWRRARKFQSTYLEPLANVSVAHPSYLQVESWTGRMSCRRPNLSNLPKRTETDADENLKIRSVFIPREDHSFVVCDFEAIEMRILAYYLGDPGYRKLVAEGDPHAVTAAAIWGGLPEDYYKGTDKRWMRDVAKNTTFAISYGAGAPKVADTINRTVPPQHRVTTDEAKGVRSKIIAQIPGYNELAGSAYRKNGRKPWGKDGRIAKQILARGYVRTILGRQQYVAEDRLYVGLNALIQGSAADVFKSAIVAVDKATKGLGAQQLLFVHDELVTEVPTEHADECLRRTIAAMESAVAIDPPLAVAGSITEVSYAHA